MKTDMTKTIFMVKVLLVIIVVVSVPAQSYPAKLNFETDLSYVIATQSFDSQGKIEEFQGTMSELRLTITERIAISKKAEFVLVIPYVDRIYSWNSPYSLKNYSNSGSGIGDISLGFGGNLLTESDSLPKITGNSEFIFPTGRNLITTAIGDNELPVGGPMFMSGTSFNSMYGGSRNLGLNLDISKKVGRVVLEANLGYVITMETVSIYNEKINLGDITKYAIKIEHSSENTAYMLNINGARTSTCYVDNIEAKNTDSNILKLTPGINFSDGKELTFKFNIDFPISGKNEYNGMGVSVGITYEFGK